jgi:hypothetical protein
VVIVIAQIKPPVVPSTVRQDELHRDVELASTRSHMKGAATGVHHLSHSPLARLLGEVLRLEEVHHPPHSPTRPRPQETVANQLLQLPLRYRRTDPRLRGENLALSRHQR